MATAPRFIPPGSLIEITFRTNAARMSLRPSRALNAAMLAIIGRALSMYPVKLHAFHFMSNHWHAIVTVVDGLALSRFMQFVHGNVAKAAQRINRVRGKVWQSRAMTITVLEDAAQLVRLRYVLAHGTKEKLVASPIDWPGVTSARALLGLETLIGYWVDHEEKRRLERSGRTPHPTEYTKEYRIELEPLPVMEKLSEVERMVMIREIIEDIKATYPGPYLGAAAVLAENPKFEPENPKRSSAPAVHTTSTWLRRRFREARRLFFAAYREAAAEHARRPTVAAWPFDSFLTAVQYVSTHISTGIGSERHIVGQPTLMRMLL
jgi:REP element-mobilizing transposase RayT